MFTCLIVTLFISTLRLSSSRDVSRVFATLTPRVSLARYLPLSLTFALVNVPGKGRRLAAEVKRMKLDAAEKAKEYARLQAQRAAEHEEMLSTRKQLRAARSEVRLLITSGSKGRKGGGM